MINIAVLVYDLINEYNHTVVHGISQYFEDKDDVRLIIAPVCTPDLDNPNHDYQYWTSVKLLESEHIDGIIVIPNSFASTMEIPELTNHIKSLENKPIVSVSAPLKLKNIKYTQNSCKVAFEQVVEHLKNVHGCKKFAFFGAGLLNNTESTIRFEQFKNALKNNDLAFYPELVFEGDFTPGVAHEQMAKRIKTKEDINFDAILCVNDYTAGGVLLHFLDLGVKCPDDVKVIGFDDSDFAVLTYPTLTSISQTVPVSGQKAAEAIYKTVKKEPVDDVTIITSFPVYRQSCGCIDSTTHSTSFIDHFGKFYNIDERKREVDFNVVQKHQETLFSIYGFLNALNSQTQIKDLPELLKKSMKSANMTALMVCFYEHPNIVTDKEDLLSPQKAKVQLGINLLNNMSVNYQFNEGPEFDLSKKIAPENFEQVLGGEFYLHPIFSHNKNYGYMLCKSSNYDLILISIHLKIFSDIIANSYEFTLEQKRRLQLLEKNHDLSLSIRTDELTQILNRKGIIEYGQQLLTLSSSMDNKGTVFFCDLDNLKTINDTWGHKVGDIAIKTEAKVLKALFRDSDLIGRLSGDEFCVIAPGFPLRKLSAMRKQLQELNEQFSKEENLPFTLSLSVGATEFDANHTNLMELLQAADDQLYKEKKIKHAERDRLKGSQKTTSVKQS